jgi:hypothetical protein
MICRSVAWIRTPDVTDLEAEQHTTLSENTNTTESRATPNKINIAVTPNRLIW